MMEGLLRDKMLAGRIPYSASFNAEDILKLFLHVLNWSPSTPEQLASHAKHATWNFVLESRDLCFSY